MRITSQDWLSAQNSVLGAALIDEKAAVRVLSETEERDYSGASRTVYNAMRSLFLEGKPLDPVTVCSKLGSEYRPYIAELMEVTPSVALLDQHIPLCKEQARVLALRELANQLAQADT